jgi:LysR family glycine cleavage system transcriptional activator
MNLPPLNALRAFEAAARHNSFAKAADEMHVSPGAVSRHVKILEGYFALTLFDRKAQGLRLTDVGRQLLPEITEAFRRISGAAMRAKMTSSEIRVVAAPTFAVRWLMPHLPEFHELYPDIRVSIGLCTTGERLSEGAYDVGVMQEWWIDEVTADVETRLLRYERLTPVCTPAVARRPPRLQKPSDLRDRPLLHTLDTKDWEAWLKAVGETRSPASRDTVYRTGDSAARAAMSGKGIAIVDLDLYKYELDSGQLVAPFDTVLCDVSRIVLFSSPGRLRETNIRLFADWLESSVGPRGRAGSAGFT